MGFESLRKILTTNVIGNAARGEMQIAQIFESFRAVLVAFWGDERANVVELVSFHEGQLKVATHAPAAKQQLSLDALRIRNEVNRRLGALVVRKIVVETRGF